MNVPSWKCPSWVWMLGILVNALQTSNQEQREQKSWKIYELFVCYTRLGSILKPTKGAGGATTRQYKSNSDTMQWRISYTELSWYPGYFREPHRLSVGLPKKKKKKKTRAILTGMLITISGHMFQSTDNLNINPLTPVKQWFIKTWQCFVHFQKLSISYFNCEFHLI